MESDNRVSSFISTILQSRSTGEINSFFLSVIEKNSELHKFPELFILYKKLSTGCSKSKVLKLLLTLKNYLITNKLQKMTNFVPGLSQSQGNNIRVKLMGVSSSSVNHYLADLRHLEIFGFTESGEVSQTSNVKLKILNYSGLVYFNSDSGALIEFRSLELRTGYEIYFAGLECGEDGFVIRVDEVGEDFICLASDLNSFKFCEGYKDLRRTFEEIQFGVDLERNGQSWIIICRNNFKPFLVLRESYERSWFFVPCGLSFSYGNTKYSIKYSYLS